jgi:carbon-monoxide dehydrogenase medium subunit
MKPVAFEYAAPTDLDEAIALLDAHGDEAKVLAGGQSLMPMLNFRLVRPSILIDINRIDELSCLKVTDDVLTIGALARTAELEFSSVVDQWPLLRAAAAFVGHPAIRNRGTIAGSAAHADPSAELPAALLALDARFTIRSIAGERVLDASAFFSDYYTTAIESTDLLVRIEIDPQPPFTGIAFIEHSRTHGDFALSGVAASVTLNEERRCSMARLALLGMGSTPIRARQAEDALRGSVIDDATAREAASLAISACDPADPVDYRLALGAELTRRAVLLAFERALQ